jgi:hypothetical protein
MLSAAELVVDWKRSSRLLLPRADLSALPEATQQKMVAAVVSRRRMGNPLIVVALYMQLPPPDSVLGIGEQLRRPAGLCVVAVTSHTVVLFVAEILNIAAGMVRGTWPGLLSLLVVFLALYVKIKSKKSANRRIDIRL